MMEMMIVGQISNKQEALMVSGIVKRSIVGKRARLLGSKARGN